MNPDNQPTSVKLDKPIQIGSAKAELSRGVSTHETNPGNSIEMGPQTTEPIKTTQNTPVAPILPTPVTAVTTASDDGIIIDAPAIAKDEDLIEKEWVDKAKQIVNQTKNDPHQREKGVTKLKVDYLKKRFGRDLGSSE